jgi:hypothetical protein
MDAAASEPVFWSACFVVNLGSLTTLRRRRVCDIRVETGRVSKSSARGYG